jgi:hypothetical protein
VSLIIAPPQVSTLDRLPRRAIYGQSLDLAAYDPNDRPHQAITSLRILNRAQLGRQIQLRIEGNKGTPTGIPPGVHRR